MSTDEAPRGTGAGTTLILRLWQLHR
jgi:hypothetical protein